MAPASTKLKKRGDDYHHGDLRNALLAAARRTLDEGNYETLSLRELARRAGVSANAPYRHFASKDEILAHVAAGGSTTSAGASMRCAAPTRSNASSACRTCTPASPASSPPCIASCSAPRSRP
jgi:AcrR family transcriptional regulator